MSRAHTSRFVLRNVATLVLLASIPVAIVGCGGEDENGSIAIPIPDRFTSPSSVVLMELTSSDLGHDPVVHVDEGRGPRNGFIHIGPDIVGLAERLPLDMRQAQRPLIAAGHHDGVSVSYGTQVDGLTNGHVSRVDYAFDISPDGTILRFAEEPPIVEIVGNATPDMVSDLVLVLQQVNTALPSDWQLGFVAEDPHPFYGPDIITVSFVEEVTGTSEGALGNSLRHVSQGVFESAEIMVKDQFWLDAGDRETGRHVLAHELLHALGRGHSQRLGNAPISVMLPRVESDNVLDGHTLHQADREGLMIVYGRLQPGGSFDDMITRLDDWTNPSLHVRGRLDFPAQYGMDFGVALHNGFAQPWVSGPAPWGFLQSNPALSGTASWDGRLLGFTPSSAFVAGSAGLNVDLGTMDGMLEFDNLEQWQGSPGTLGTGTVWGDGALDYQIAVMGNTFKQIGGDTGIVTGAFLGEQHEGMGGTLKREDLTAAFGGER